METFRFKTQRNEVFQSYSNFNRKIALNLRSVKNSQSNCLPPFKSNSVFTFKQNILPDKKNSNNNFSKPVKQKQSLLKHSKSTHQMNYGERTQTTLTLMPTTFRKKSSPTDYIKSDEIDFPHKKLKKIELLMKQKKQKFEWTLRRSHSKLNFSYKNSFQDIIKHDIATINQHRLSESQSMDIKMETKSRKKIVFKGDSKFMEKFHKQKQQQIDDVFVKENNLFSIVIESRKCMDGIFPMFRNGATLSNIGCSIFLFGGVNSKLANGYHFNEYLGNQKQWICVKNQQNALIVTPSFHSVETYRNSLIFIGGSLPNSNHSKKVFNPDIIIYDTEKEQFSKISWNIGLRSHASTIYSNMLVIYGGIDQKGQFSNILYFLPLNTNNLAQTNPNPYNLGSQGLGIAFHKIVNTFDIDVHLKGKLQMDGIICYGGKFADGKLNDDLLLFRFNKSKQSTQTQRIIKGWSVVKTHGTKPEPRFNHSMNIICKKCICFVIGGMNFQGQVLNDAWILNLTNSTWVQAIFDNKYEVIQRGIFSHATTVMNGEIYVFGGMNGENRLNNEFWSIDFSFSRASRKQQQVKKSRSHIGSSKKIVKLRSKMRCV